VLGEATALCAPQPRESAADDRALVRSTHFATAGADSVKVLKQPPALHEKHRAMHIGDKPLGHGHGRESRSDPEFLEVR
jgi:hypothetical protein